MFKKIKRDEDKDGMDDTIEQKWNIHDENNKHRLPHINIGGVLPHKNGIIGIHHDGFKMGGSPRSMKLSINDFKKTKLSVDLDNPKLKMKMGDLKIPKHTLDDAGINKFLNNLKKKKAKK